MRRAIVLAYMFSAMGIGIGAWILIRHFYASQTDRGDAELLVAVTLAFYVPVACAASLPAWIMFPFLPRPRRPKRRAVLLLAAIVLPAAAWSIEFALWVDDFAHWVEWLVPSLFYLPTIACVLFLGLFTQGNRST